MHMAKCQCGKARSREEKKVLIALALAGEVISGQCQLKLKENQDANSIIETTVLKVRETNKIREIYREICEIPESRVKLS